MRVKQYLLDFWRGDQQAATPETPSRPEEHRGWRSEHGQSLVEYCILLTWTCLAMMAMINAAAGNTKKVWTVANQDLSTANTTAS